MSDASKPIVPPQLLPGSVSDERQRAFIGALDAGLQSVDIQSFVMTDADTVKAELLPYLVREYSLQEFITPNLKEHVTRRFIKRAYDLHAKKGYVEGTRLGLSLLGVDVDWQQWWQLEPIRGTAEGHIWPDRGAPKGHHNTHIITAYANEVIFEGQDMFFDGAVQDACLKIIRATQRWSQTIAFKIGIKQQSTVFVASAIAAKAVDRRIIKPQIRNRKSEISIASAFAAKVIDRRVVEFRA